MAIKKGRVFDEKGKLVEGDTKTYVDEETRKYGSEKALKEFAKGLEESHKMRSLREREAYPGEHADSKVSNLAVGVAVLNEPDLITTELKIDGYDSRIENEVNKEENR